VDCTHHPKFPLAFGELASGRFPHCLKIFSSETIEPNLAGMVFWWSLSKLCPTALSSIQDGSRYKKERKSNHD